MYVLASILCSFSHFHCKELLEKSGWGSVVEVMEAEDCWLRPTKQVSEFTVLRYFSTVPVRYYSTVSSQNEVGVGGGFGREFHVRLFLKYFRIVGIHRVGEGL